MRMTTATLIYSIARDKLLSLDAGTGPEARVRGLFWRDCAAEWQAAAGKREGCWYGHVAGHESGRV